MTSRERLNQIIFESDTPAGRAFDVALLWAIVISVAVVIIDSVAGVQARVGPFLRVLEWTFTIFFTVEYALRLYSARDRGGYARSFFGVIDFLAVLPTWVTLFFPGGQSLLLLRALRLLRLFRIFKLGRYSREAHILVRALIASREKIAVFLYTVATVVVAAGALMYFVEGEVNGFSSIPTSMYWAIVTMTTVGYGDIAPQTTLGRLIASLLMVTGYGIIAVPTGIVTVELAEASRQIPDGEDRSCGKCGLQRHGADAHFCRVCGSSLPPIVRNFS